jgi:aryl-alcohol dehydrogenase-like predicted oxidoreductase
MALRSILSNPQVSTTIVGMRSLDHVRANIPLSDCAGSKPDLLQTLRQHLWDRDVASWAS